MLQVHLLFYSFFLLVMRLFIGIGSFLNKKIRFFYQARKSNWKKITAYRPTHQKTVWMHCASVGEYEQGRPILVQLKNQCPDIELVLTFFSPSGFLHNQSDALVDHIFYLPLDGRRHAKKWIETIKPDLALFVKYEFWYWYSRQLKTASIPLILVSGIFRPVHPFFKWYGGFFRSVLKNFTYFYLQDERSKQLLEQIGQSNCEVTGDTRVDRVIELINSQQQNEITEVFVLGGKPVFIVGSCWDDDLDVLIPFIKNHLGQFKFIIAPHEISDKIVHRIISIAPDRTIKYTEGNPNDHHSILVVNTIGQLAMLYQYAKFAWIGGAYSVGLHNILEPAVHGMPLFFGDKAYQKFKEAEDLLELGVAHAISNTASLTLKMEQLTPIESYQEIKRKCLDYIQANKGAAKRIADGLIQNKLL